MKSPILLLLLALTSSVPAATITFDTADAPGDGEGWWSATRAADPGNYIFLTGYAVDASTPFPNPIVEYRSHLSFSVSGIDAPIQSAVLRLSEWGSFSNGSLLSGTVTLGLFDVSTDPYDLNSANTARPDIFQDLGTGVSYGTSVITVGHEFSDTRILEIPLNQAGIDAIQNGGVFSVGLRIMDGDGTQFHYLFGNTGSVPSPFVHELQVTTVPEPGLLPLLTLTPALGLLRRRRR